MNRDELLERFDKVAHLARLSKWERFFTIPVKYVAAMGFRHLIYPMHHLPKFLHAPLFFGIKMKIGLPSATDIYLTGGRSHPSEIRFARYLILQLQEGMHVMDIGAHYGYFSLLAAELVGREGKVMSFEPSPKTFAVLKENSNQYPVITAVHKAMSDQEGDFTIYEFPNLYSEYNTANPLPFEKEKWIKSFSPESVSVGSTTIDVVTSQGGFRPTLIKLDAEGSEFHILQGGQAYIQKHYPDIAMRFWQSYRQNQMHRIALSLLAESGYQPFCIDINGSLKPVEDLEMYLVAQDIESDTFIFKHI